MSALPFAISLTNEVYIDVILHYTCRDRNTLSITADFIGAYSLGIDNILAIHGDPPSVGDYPFATSVFEITPPGLIRIIKGLNKGKNEFGNKLPSKTNFYAGVGLNVNANNLDAELNRLQKKLQAGDDFIQTQPIYDPIIIKNIKAKMAEKLDSLQVPIITNILPLASAKHAEFLHNEVPGIEVPQTLRNDLNKTQDNTTTKSIELCTELIEEIQNYCNGICFMPPHKNYKMIEDILAYVKDN